MDIHQLAASPAGAVQIRYVFGHQACQLYFVGHTVQVKALSAEC